MQKVFGLGLSKTGTKTLGRALSILGYRNTSFNKNLLVDWSEGRHSSIWQRIEQFDGFNDWPYPLLSTEIMERYGHDAFYILTVRESPEVWLESLKGHALRGDPGNAEFRRIAYGALYPQLDEQAHLDRYRVHNENVLQSASRLGLEKRLRVMCWERGDGWSALCGHLSLPAPEVPFPHVSSWRSRQFKQAVVDENLQIIARCKAGLLAQ